VIGVVWRWICDPVGERGLVISACGRHVLLSVRKWIDSLDPLGNSKRLRSFCELRIGSMLSYLTHSLLATLRDEMVQFDTQAIEYAIVGKGAQRFFALLQVDPSWPAP